VIVAERNEPSPKRAPAKRAATKRAATEQVDTNHAAAPERDWVDQMVDALAKMAEHAREANAADVVLEGGARPGGAQGTSKWWSLPMRRRERHG